ncbi:PASTA domain-containing protein [Actinoplanes flavus]|uniref:PASTA domain-containing protein n=1 Tax=Actinoplanes flavus TaxID=2820290 RepID=A0ABS3UTV5_9ACTN|nr:PASTA domain-containing protein [Actinoplanes flavus]MBO3742013.1 PASTA domain-containing protein [Actinoplanes flavus]
MPEEREPERDDETRPLSSVDEQPSPQPEDPGADVWTGRAGVRPYGAYRREQFDEDGDWADRGPAEPSGRWWAPIAIGTVSLILLGLLGFGIVVIVQNADGEVETPGATPTVRATTTEPADPGITTPPTVTETITTPATTDAAEREVTVPALRGMPLADAQAALTRSRLGYRVIRRESDAEPGTVINCDPPEGLQVPSDTRVTLIVAIARTDDPSPATPAASAGG